MTAFISDVTYSIMLAKSSRAKCKTCKEPIQKGDMKIFAEYPLKEGASFAMSNSTHVSCFKIPRKLKAQGVGVVELISDFLSINDDDDLLNTRKFEVIDLLFMAQSSKPTKSKVKSETDSNSPMDLMERLKAAAKQDGDDLEPAKKKAKTSKGSKQSMEDAEFLDMLSLYRKYQKGYTVAQLKDILRWNKQIMVGAKTFVLFKVLDGELHGRLSFCPVCQGDLKFLEGDYDKIHCSGRFDEDMGRRIPCSYTAPRLANPESLRVQPFYVEEPSEAEKEAMEQAREDAREGGGSASNSVENPIAKELLEKAEALEGKLDFSTNPGRKHAVGEFLALVQGKVDLPENRNAKMEIGKLVMANYNGKSATEIMKVIFDRYGFANIKEEQAAAKEAALEAACANPKNASLILAFEECAKYYFAESNTNAAITYKKAIATLTELKDEVTEDNAMSFSKGKTKLPGIGKGTAQKMLEFVQTGTFAKLEEKRQAHS